MEILVREKVKLLEWLGTDPHLLQHVHSDGILPTRVYKQVKELSDKAQTEQAYIKLIDTIIQRGEETSAQFLQLLKKPEILNIYPQLKELDPSFVPPAVPGKR